jgi:hypothetical protein
MAVNPRHTPRLASTGMVAQHGPESWPGMLRNWWPAWTGIRTRIASRNFVTECLMNDVTGSGQAWCVGQYFIDLEQSAV